MGLSGLIVILVGLGFTVGIGLVVVIGVATASMREQGKITGPQKFRLPAEMTGYSRAGHAAGYAGGGYSRGGYTNAAYGFFGHDDDTSHLATREQAAVTAIRDDSYVLQPQPRRHAAPALHTLRPRTRHWKIPPTGTGVRTALGLLFR